MGEKPRRLRRAIREERRNRRRNGRVTVRTDPSIIEPAVVDVRELPANWAWGKEPA